MCKECGCGMGGEATFSGPAHDHEHDHEHSHGHAHGHGQHHHHHHAPAPAHGHGTRSLELNRSLLEQNDRLAEQNRGWFRARGLFVLNVLSSPGSGKTTLIRETCARLAGQVRAGVIVGDLATDNDAARLRDAGVPVVQINTGTVCHLEAAMVARALERLGDAPLDLLIIENVGNLVCPADFDLGEHLRVVLLATTEGEDKPLKYPPMFHSADAAVITKTDLAAAAGFDRGQALANLRRISHHARIFELSARTGEGMAAWVEFVRQRRPAPRPRG